MKKACGIKRINFLNIHNGRIDCMRNHCSNRAIHNNKEQVLDHFNEISFYQSGVFYKIIMQWYFLSMFKDFSISLLVLRKMTLIGNWPFNFIIIQFIQAKFNIDTFDTLLGKNQHPMLACIFMIREEFYLSQYNQTLY